MLDTENFPDEVKEALAPHMGVPDADVLASIATAIVSRRDEAVWARKEIEGVWTEAEEAYIGIDDQNRHEFGGLGQRWAKPQAMEGPVTTNQRPQRKDVKATAFVRLTARYVDAGAGKLIEILLPPDDRPFSFKEMPVPDLIQAKDDNSPVVHDGLNNAPLFRPLKPGEQPPPAVATAPQPATAAPPVPSPALASPPASVAGPQASAPAGTPPPAGAAGAPPGQTPLTVKDLANEKIEIARKAAKAAEDRVYNWMVECGRTAEVRKMIFDAARIGTGVVKGPIPITKRGMMVRKEGGDTALLIEDKLLPATKWVDPWNLFPDPSCGEDIHDGDYILEKDSMAERQVRKLKDQPGYIAAQIDKVLLEGPERINVAGEGGEGSGAKPGDKTKRKRYPIWYYYGTLKRDEYLALRTPANKPKGAKADYKPGSELKPDQELVYCICTLINDTVVKAVINPLGSGEFPYHAFPWQRRAGHWAGIGVGEQMRVPQRITNAATRSLLNNAGKSAGSQIVLNRACITPGDGAWTITPDKIWFLNQDAPAMSDVRQAFTIFNIPNVTPQMMEIINYGMQLAEESTSIPLVTQGQTGETAPDTLGATQIQNSNANQLLRTIGYTFDDYVTEKEIRGYYEWLLNDPDVPDEEKAEFEIDAHGSVALVERAIMDQTIAQMGPTVLNSAYGIDPKKWAQQFLKTKRLDPEDFNYTPEDQAKMDANPVKPVQVQVAETRAASAEKIAQSAQQLDHDKAATEATVDLHELALKKELAMLEYANRERISLNDVKTQLAQTAMKLTAQERLNAQDNAHDMRKHLTEKPNTTTALKPPVQAPGRAGNGKAFSQAR